MFPHATLRPEEKEVILAELECELKQEQQVEQRLMTLLENSRARLQRLKSDLQLLEAWNASWTEPIADYHRNSISKNNPENNRLSTHQNPAPH
jgi:hypothetical protein